MNKQTQQILIFIAIGLVLYMAKDLFKAVGSVGKGINSGVKATTETLGKTTDNFGITSSEASKALKQMECFSPSFYKKYSGAKLLTMAAAKDFAKKIYDAKIGSIYINDAEVLGVLKQLSALTQVSFLAEQFSKIYSRDLLQFIYPNMEDRNATLLYEHLSKLPIK